MRPQKLNPSWYDSRVQFFKRPNWDLPVSARKVMSEIMTILVGVGN